MANERLYQFPSKASPVPADIIYGGDSASAFDEVNMTIAQLISAYPNLSGIGGLTLGANTYPYSNASAVITAGTISALAVTLLADTTIATMQGTLGYTATATASLFAGWDANVNLSANNFNAGYATTVTAAMTTTLTVASASQQYFTGTTTQTVAMPVTSTLVLGQSWLFVNLSTGTVTIQSSGGNTITTVGANSSTRVTCILTSGTMAASWSSSQPIAGEGTVNSGTINDLAYYAASGSAISALATGNNGVLVTSAGGVPSISSTLPSSLVIPSPKITTGIYDTNGNEMLAFTATASAVNYLTMSNSTTGNAVSFGAAGTDTDIITSIGGKGKGGALIQGNTSGLTAAAGNIGEYISSIVLVGSAVSFSNGTPKNLTSISLTAGDWDVWGEVWTVVGSGTVTTVAEGGITSASSSAVPTVPADATSYFQHVVAGGANATYVFPLDACVINVSTTTIVYLNCDFVFSVSTLSAYGKLCARRRH